MGRSHQRWALLIRIRPKELGSCLVPLGSGPAGNLPKSQILIDQGLPKVLGSCLVPLGSERRVDAGDVFLPGLLFAPSRALLPAPLVAGAQLRARRSIHTSQRRSSLSLKHVPTFHSARGLQFLRCSGGPSEVAYEWPGSKWPLPTCGPPVNRSLGGFTRVRRFCPRIVLVRIRECPFLLLHLIA